MRSYSPPPTVRGIPRYPDDGLSEARFDGFDSSLVSGGLKARIAVEAWTEAAWRSILRRDETPFVGVVLVGPTGTGKTHLLTAAARSLSGELGRAGERRIVLVSELHLRELARSCWRRGRGLDERVRRLIAGDVRTALVYDDLGAASDDERFVAEIRDLLALRHASQFRTLVALSTNLDLSEIENRYGPRLASRLFESALAYPLEGDDRRSPRRAEK